MLCFTWYTCTCISLFWTNKVVFLVHSHHRLKYRGSITLAQGDYLGAWIHFTCTSSQNASKADEGNYTCRAENQFGSQEATVTVHVFNSTAILSGPGDLSIVESQSPVLHCTARADSRDLDEWVLRFDSCLQQRKWRASLFARHENHVKLFKRSCMGRLPERNSKWLDKNSVHNSGMLILWKKSILKLK